MGYGRVKRALQSSTSQGFRVREQRSELPDRRGHGPGAHLASPGCPRLSFGNFGLPLIKLRLQTIHANVEYDDPVSWQVGAFPPLPHIQFRPGAERSNDLVLWSGVSGEKEKGPPNMFAKEFPAGEDQAVMARTAHHTTSHHDHG